MKKFITTLAAALVIGSAASAATFVEVFRIDGERYMIKVPATNVLQQVVDTHAIPTAGGTYSTLVADTHAIPTAGGTYDVGSSTTVANADTHAIPTAGGTYDVGSSTTVANYNWEALPDSEHLTIDADPFAEEIVGGLGPQLPYDPMRGVDYGFVQALKQLAEETVADYNWDAMPTSERITSVTVANYNWEALPASERVPTSANVVYNWDAIPANEHFVADADLFTEEIVGGLGPQLPYDPMRGVDYGFVQALLQQNVDPFSEEVVGGLGPQINFVASN